MDRLKHPAGFGVQQLCHLVARMGPIGVGSWAA
jgi:hypothetical protein